MYLHFDHPPKKHPEKQKKKVKLWPSCKYFPLLAAAKKLRTRYATISARSNQFWFWDRIPETSVHVTGWYKSGCLETILEKFVTYSGQGDSIGVMPYAIIRRCRATNYALGAGWPMFTCSAHLREKTGVLGCPGDPKPQIWCANIVHSF